MWSHRGDEGGGASPSATTQQAIRAALQSGLSWVELAANREHDAWRLAELSFRGASELIRPA